MPAVTSALYVRQVYTLLLVLLLVHNVKLEHTVKLDGPSALFVRPDVSAMLWRPRVHYVLLAPLLRDQGHLHVPPVPPGHSLPQIRKAVLYVPMESTPKPEQQSVPPVASANLPYL